MCSLTSEPHKSDTNTDRNARSQIDGRVANKRRKRRYKEIDSVVGW